MKKNVARSCVLMFGLLVLGCSMKEQAPPAEIRQFSPRIPIVLNFKITDLGGYSSNDSFFSLGFSGDRFYRISPGVDKKVVMTAADNGLLSAINARTGKIKWQIKTNRVFSSAIALNRGVAFVGCEDGTLVAYQVNDGKLIWQKELDASILSAPTIVDHRLLLVHTQNDTVYALSQKTGKVVWQYHENTPEVIVHADSSPVVFGGRYVMAGLSKGQMIILSLGDGTLLARKQLFKADSDNTVQRMLDIVANPVIVGDVAYLASSHGGIAAYDIRSSKVLWRSELVTIHNMAHDAHHLFVVTPSAEVYALDLRTGRVKWHQEEMHNRRLSAPVILKNTLVVADGFGSIFWLSAKSGKMLAYQVPGASAISASPVVKGNAVYFYSLWGTLIKYSLNSR